MIEKELGNAEGSQVTVKFRMNSPCTNEDSLKVTSSVSWMSAVVNRPAEDPSNGTIVITATQANENSSRDGYILPSINGEACDSKKIKVTQKGGGGCTCASLTPTGQIVFDKTGKYIGNFSYTPKDCKIVFKGTDGTFVSGGIFTDGNGGIDATKTTATTRTAADETSITVEIWIDGITPACTTTTVVQQGTGACTCEAAGVTVNPETVNIGAAARSTAYTEFRENCTTYVPSTAGDGNWLGIRKNNRQHRLIFTANTAYQSAGSRSATVNIYAKQGDANPCKTVTVIQPGSGSGSYTAPQIKFTFLSEDLPVNTFDMYCTITNNTGGTEYYAIIGEFANGCYSQQRSYANDFTPFFENFTGQKSDYTIKFVLLNYSATKGVAGQCDLPPATINIQGITESNWTISADKRQFNTTLDKFELEKDAGGNINIVYRIKPRQ